MSEYVLVFSETVEVQNLIQFNGYYGCCYCEQPGRTAQTENGGHVHTFLYILDSPKGPPRTQQACMQYAVETEFYKVKT